MAQEDDRRKHLEMLQAECTRLANNGFYSKLLAVALSAGIVTFAPKSEQFLTSGLMLAPLLVLWCLDAHFLHEERRFRKLFKRASQNRTPVYRMEPHPDMDNPGLGFFHLFKLTIWPIYITLIAALFFVARLPFLTLPKFLQAPTIKASPQAK